MSDNEQTDFEEFTLAVLTSFRAAANYHAEQLELMAVGIVRGLSKIVLEDIARYAHVRELDLGAITAAVESSL